MPTKRPKTRVRARSKQAAALAMPPARDPRDEIIDMASELITTLDRMSHAAVQGLVMQWYQQRNRVNKDLFSK